MNEVSEDYRFQSHEFRITDSEKRIHGLESSVSAILSNQAVTNERLSTISKQLDNGIKAKLDRFEKDLNEIMPLVKSKAELEKTLRNSLLIIACGGAVSLILFVLKQYLLNGP